MINIAFVLLLIVIIGLSRLYLKQRLNKQLMHHAAALGLKDLSLKKLTEQNDGLLAEKEWLMKEIHHRVKNNLQIVISLLNTQSAYLKNDIAFNAVKESQHRMQSISLVHQKLYQSGSLATVDMKPYITDLVAYLSDSFDADERISFELDIHDAEFNVRMAVPIGLILNEAITNSLKYAFPSKKEKGLITIKLLNYNKIDYELIIGDNGVGDASVNERSGDTSLGMSLIRGLSKQIKGTLKIKNEGGLVISIRFSDELTNNNILQFLN
ncbi:sensor histidine kinase [Pedobacter metabolipauper]|nr:sensor histidine kinase [Pedobacter metabolipauper]